jgi:hypothetical protein
MGWLEEQSIAVFERSRSRESVWTRAFWSMPTKADASSRLWGRALMVTFDPGEDREGLFAAFSRLPFRFFEVEPFKGPASWRIHMCGGEPIPFTKIGLRQSRLELSCHRGGLDTACDLCLHQNFREAGDLANDLGEMDAVLAWCHGYLGQSARVCQRLYLYEKEHPLYDGTLREELVHEDRGFHVLGQIVRGERPDF